MDNITNDTHNIGNKEQVQYGKYCYNQAIDDAIKNATIIAQKNYTGRGMWDMEYLVNKQSLLELKK